MVLSNDRIFRARPVTVEARPLRVCMMVTYDLASPCGGVKHHAQQLAAALRRRGDEVTVVGPASKPVHAPHTHTFRGVVNAVPLGGKSGAGHQRLLLARPRWVSPPSRPAPHGCANGPC